MVHGHFDLHLRIVLPLIQTVATQQVWPADAWIIECLQEKNILTIFDPLYSLSNRQVQKQLLRFSEWNKILERP